MTNRRHFLRNSVGLSLVASGFAPSLFGEDIVESNLQNASISEAPSKWLKKTLKIGMVNVKGSLTEKFQAAKEAGFDGIELDAPGFDVEEAKQAVESTGLPIDGSVNSTHWQIRHTSPDSDQRVRALKSLEDGIRMTAAVGGKTILLVPGHGQDGKPEEIFDRAVENITLALPLAEEKGVKIAIENVWNGFLYDHNGGSDQTADLFAKFVDAFDSPLVGMQFDIGNHWKYGDPAKWIVTLGDRIIKLDAKGFSRENGNFTKIGEGDIDWASVRVALKKIKFTGWVAAEVGGGGPERLAEISKNLDEKLIG